MKYAHPNPTVPGDLYDLYQAHRARLPPISTVTADGMRAQLRAIGVEPPAPPAPGPTSAASAARHRPKKAEIGP